jgi:hypothetical protein
MSSDDDGCRDDPDRAKAKAVKQLLVIGPLRALAGAGAGALLYFIRARGEVAQVRGPDFDGGLIEVMLFGAFLACVTYYARIASDAFAPPR